MTKDEALTKALGALYDKYSVDKAISAIKEALAQPDTDWTPERIAGMARLKEAQDKKLAQPEQEPAAWLTEERYSQLHTAQRPWVGLTDREKMMCRSYDIDEAIAKTEAKLKEKNT